MAENNKEWKGSFNTSDLANIDFQNNGENRTKVFNRAAEVINKTAQDLKQNPLGKANTKAEAMNQLRSAIAKNIDEKDPTSADNIFNFVSMDSDFKNADSYNVKRFVQEFVPKKFQKDILNDIVADQKQFTKQYGIESPKTEFVTPEGDKTVEVQTVTDTKDVRGVGDLEEENPSEMRELKGSKGKTTTTNYINQSEDKDNVVNEKQVETVWDKYKDTPETVPTVEEITSTIETKRDGGKIDGSVSPTPIKEKELDPELKKKVDTIRRGIWTDFNNGFFGDVSRGKAWKELTPEEKESRSEAWWTAFRFTADAIGTMLWNIGSAFGRKGEPYMENEYSKMLAQQNKGLVENEQYVRSQQTQWDSLLSRSEQWKELPGDIRSSVLSYLVTLGGDVENLSQAEYVDVIGRSLAREKQRQVDMLNANIEKIIAETGITKEQANLLREEIKSAIINNEYLPERIEATVNGMHLDNAGKVVKAVSEGLSSITNIGKLIASF